MRWRATAVVAISFVVVGCGGHGRTDIEEAFEAAFVHRDQAKAEWLLAEAEFDQAELKAAQADAAKVLGQLSKATKQDRWDARDAVRHAHGIERRCEEGFGSEPCSELGRIEAIVTEMAEELGAP